MKAPEAFRVGLICILAGAIAAGCGADTVDFDASTPLIEAPPLPAMHTDMPAYGPAVIENWPFEERDHGYTLHNRIHNLDFHFRNDHVSATRRGAKWTWTWRLQAAGRLDSMKPVRPAAPHVAPCQTDACNLRLEYRRVEIVEWYVNTLHGIEQGFDILERPDGEGLLRMTATVGGMRARLANGSTTVNFETFGKVAFSYSGLRVNDRYGKTLEASFFLSGDTLELVVDDEGARYPITIDPTSGACDEAWCFDGDESTIDVCNWSKEGAPECTNLFDSSFAAKECVWGKYCCDDGTYDEGCYVPPEPVLPDPLDPATLCPAAWCEDGDFTTVDICANFEAPSAFECLRKFDEATLGQECIWEKFCCSGLATNDCDNLPAPAPKEPVDPSACPASWCNDGDDATLDTCKMVDAKMTCSSEVDPEKVGDSCSYGTYCCNGTIAAEPCVEPVPEDPPPADPPPTTNPCPPDNDWCEDGDATTLNACSNYDQAQGSFTCTTTYDVSKKGQTCTEGVFCCNGTVNEPCEHTTDGGDTADGTCPASWCDDGDPTTKDSCTTFEEDVFGCLREFDESQDGKVCSYGLYCCKGAVARTCEHEAPKDPPPATPAPGPPPGDPPPATPPPASPPPSSGDAFAGQCLISMDGTGCPAQADVCNTTFTGGGGCTTAPGTCSTGGAAFKISPNDDQLVIDFGQNISAMSATFGHTEGAGGAMLAVGANGATLSVTMTSNTCQQPVGQTTLTFPQPARSLILSATGGDVFLDQLNLTAQ